MTCPHSPRNLIAAWRDTAALDDMATGDDRYRGYHVDARLIADPEGCAKCAEEAEPPVGREVVKALVALVCAAAWFSLASLLLTGCHPT